MSTKYPLLLRVIAVGGSAVLALGVSTGVAAAQTGSLESGFGLDIEAVLSPAEELFPVPGSLDEAVAAADTGSGAGSSDERGEAQRALPPPPGGSSVGGGSAGGALTGIPGAGSLDPIQPGLGAGEVADPDAPVPGPLAAEAGNEDGPGAGGGPAAGADIAHGAALTALLAMTGGQYGDGTGVAELPPLPSSR